MLSVRVQDVEMIVDKIKEFIQEFKIKNALVLDSLMGEYRNLKYILKPRKDHFILQEKRNRDACYYKKR